MPNDERLKATHLTGLLTMRIFFQYTEGNAFSVMQIIPVFSLPLALHLAYVAVAEVLHKHLGPICCQDKRRRSCPESDCSAFSMRALTREVACLGLPAQSKKTVTVSIGAPKHSFAAEPLGGPLSLSLSRQTYAVLLVHPATATCLS